MISTMVSNTSRTHHHQYHSSARTHHKSQSSNHLNSNASLSSQDGSSTSSQMIYVEDQDDDINGVSHSHDVLNNPHPNGQTLSSEHIHAHSVPVHHSGSIRSECIPEHSADRQPPRPPSRPLSSRQSNGMQYFTNHAINAPSSHSAPHHSLHSHSTPSSHGSHGGVGGGGGSGPSHHERPHRHHHQYNNRRPPAHNHSSLFTHDYTKNWLLFSKLNSVQDYYSNTGLPFNLGAPDNTKKYSDCPSDTCSLDSRRKKVKRKASPVRRLFCGWKRANEFCVEMGRVSFEFGVTSCHRVQKWQKWLHEQPLEVKEKYFFVASTVCSTVLFYILFLCLDFMIRHWFALPLFIVRYSFSISYCISYLTSVIWQHFFNQYFVFTMAISAPPSDAFCDSLLRTYVVYGTSLLITGIIGSVLQVYAGLADEFVLVLTLPMSGVMNYYLLRCCHHREQHQYHALATTDNGYHHSHSGGGGHKSNRHHHRDHHSKYRDHDRHRHGRDGRDAHHHHHHQHHHHHPARDSHKKSKMGKATKSKVKNGKYKTQSQHQEDIVIV